MEVGIPPSKSTKRIFYNRVPKCGSSALLDTFETLSKMNNFTFIRTSNYMTFRVDIPHQVSNYTTFRVDIPHQVSNYITFRVDIPHQVSNYITFRYIYLTK